MKKALKFIYFKLCRYSGYIDSIIFTILFFRFRTTFKYSLLFLAIAIYCAYRAIKFSWKCWNSINIIRYDAQNSRIQCIEGANGRGKSSFAWYCSSVLKTPILSNVPAKVNNEFVYCLTEEHLHLIEEIPEYSTIVLDELSLFWNNTDKQNYFDAEVLLQLCRHFFDGNFYLVSIRASRIPQQIREKVSLCKMILGQETKQQSLFTLTFLNLFRRFFGCSHKIGVRTWTYQDFEEIDHENYTFDLANQTKDTINNKFSNLVECCAYSDNTRFEYNDRFMRGLYEDILKQPFSALRYENFLYSKEFISQLGYSKILQYLYSKDKTANIASSVILPLSKDSNAREIKS